MKPTLSLLKAKNVGGLEHIESKSLHLISSTCPCTVFVLSPQHMCAHTHAWVYGNTCVELEKTSVPDSRERIKGLECKTLLDPTSTFEAKSPCPYLSFMGHDPIGRLFRMLTSRAPCHSVCSKCLYSLTMGPNLAFLDTNCWSLVGNSIIKEWTQPFMTKFETFLLMQFYLYRKENVTLVLPFRCPCMPKT